MPTKAIDPTTTSEWRALLEDLPHSTQTVPSDRFRLCTPNTKLELLQDEPQDGEESAKRRFRIRANSGVPFYHPWMRNFCLDFEGMDIPNPDMPLLMNHDSDRILGFVTNVDVDKKLGLMVEGVFLDNEDSARVIKYAEQGFSWQASVYAPPSQVLRVDKGDEIEVNGHQLSGPGMCFAEWALREITITSLGADAKTGGAVFTGDADVQKFELFQREAVGVPQPKTKEPSADVTAEKLSEDHPDLVKAIRDDATKAALEAERERVKAIREKADPSQSELVDELVEKGATVTEATDALLSDLRERHAAKLSEFDDSTPESNAEVQTDVFEGKRKPKGKPDARKLFDELEVEKRIELGAELDGKFSSEEDEDKAFEAFQKRLEKEGA